MKFIQLVFEPIWRAVIVSISVALIAMVVAVGIKNHTPSSISTNEVKQASYVATPTSTNAPTPNLPPQIPLIDCVGPDGKKLRLTKKACNDFNNAWRPTVTPTSKPQTTSGASTNSNSSGSSNCDVQGATCVPNTSATITTQPVTWTFP